ncbi:amidohydrolase family protein [Streptosporangiaceae bacterium NEAU-GS5]|nr:amidohydrolase family protein [Streptosporangiaceae bacterium NEAU-GS5]
MLLRNAHIGFNGPLCDIEITDGKISAIAPDLPGGGLDVEGATVLPGLWDAHVHFTQWAQARSRIDLSGARSAAEAVALVNAFPVGGRPSAAGASAGHPGAGHSGAGRPGVGHSGVGYSGSGYSGVGRPGSGYSDAGDPGVGHSGVGHPGAGLPDAGRPGAGYSGVGRPGVGLSGAGRPGAGGVVMGFGFRDALWPDVPHKDLLPDQPVVLASNDLHTVWFSRAALALIGLGDHPTGVLRERACYEAMAALPPPPQEQVDAWVAEAAQEAAARGVVGVIDFEYADNWSDWRRRTSVRDSPLRIVCSIPVSRLDEAIERGLRGGRTEGLLEVGPVKMFVDGSLNTRTAYCDDPYPGGPVEGYGQLETPLEELAGAMAKAHAHGLRPAVHAIGDRAVAIALEAFERVGCPGRIEHAQLVRQADLARFARAGLIAGVQPAHAPDDRDVAELQWPGRTGRAYAYADLIKAGATLQFGSDAPVAPLDPWDGIASAVTRTDDDRPAWHPEEGVSLADAIAASTRGPLRAGAPADLVILEKEPDDLRHPVVLGTLLAGEWTFRA